MATEEINAGNALFVDEDIEGAIAHYTAAIKIDPQSYEAYVRRSRAHAELEEWTDAIKDAESAIALNSDAYMGYLRKGIGCFGADEFLAARSALKDALSRNPTDKDASLIRRWINKAEAEIDEAELELAKKREKEAEEEAERKRKEAEEAEAERKRKEKEAAEAAEAERKKKEAEKAQSKPAIDPKKVRYDWFQYGSKVEISIYIRGTKKEAVHFNVDAKNLDMSIDLGDGHEFSLDIDLFAEVIPEKSTFNVLPSKVEVVLVKKNDRINWSALADNGEEKVSAPQPQPQAAASTAQHPPAHPGTKKNWDKILSSDEYVDDTKPQGDDALNAVFQQIYANGTDEQRRAMIKSFTESGGTVLSTNWDEVGKAPVKGAPPKGQEMHKWNDK